MEIVDYVYFKTNYKGDESTTAIQKIEKNKFSKKKGKVVDADIEEDDK